MGSGVVVVVGVVVVLGVLLLAAVGLVGVVLMLRGRGDPVAERSEALGGLGYSALGEGRWARPIQGTSMIFEEGADGFRWTLTLPRYNTMTLELVEARSGAAVEGVFDSGVPEVDARFSLGSLQPAQVVPLIREAKLQRALLRMPNFSLTLSADELRISDPGGVGLEELRSAGSALDAERSLHQLVGAIVNALFGVLYTEAGTVFDQYR